MTNPTDLQNGLNSSVDEYNYWNDKYATDSQKLPADDAQLDDMISSGVDRGTILIFLITVYLNDAQDCQGDLLGINAGQMDIQSSLMSYTAYFQQGFGADDTLTDQQANDYAYAMYDLYTEIGGNPSDPSTPNAPPSWLSVDQQSSMLGQLNSVSDAYCEEYNTDAGAGSNKIIPWNGSTFTPADLVINENNDKHVIKTSQQQWHDQLIVTTDPDTNNPVGGHQDGYFNTVSHQYQQQSTDENNSNASLSTTQKTIADTLNDYQATWKDFNTYMDTTLKTIVQNLAVK